MTKINSLLLMVVMVLAMASCSKSRDIEKILETVPSTTGFVAAADLESILKKAGCADGLSPEMTRLINHMGSRDAKVMRALLNGNAGVAPASAVVFEDQGDMVVSVYLDDEKKFMDFFSQNSYSNTSWDSEDGGYITSGSDVMVVYKKQAWLFSNNGSMARVKEYLSLGENHSVLKLKCAEDLTSDKDVCMLININKMIQFANMSVSESSQFRMALSTLFDNARYVIGTLDMQKGEAEAEFKVLDENFDSATTTLEFSTLSKSSLAKFPGDACMIFGAALSKSAVQKLASQMEQMHLPSEVTALFNHLEGDILVGMSRRAFEPYSSGKGVGVMLTFDSESYAQDSANTLKEMAGNMANVKINGKSVYLSVEMPAGHLPAALVDALEGSAAGVALVPSDLAEASGTDAMNMWSAASASILKDGRGIKIKVDVKAADSNANILATIIKFAAKVD